MKDIFLDSMAIATLLVGALFTALVLRLNYLDRVNDRPLPWWYLASAIFAIVIVSFAMVLVCLMLWADL